MKRNYRFTLLRARLPSIYDEAESKIKAGIKPADVIIDLLIELHWRRQLGQDVTSVPKTNNTVIETTDFNEAINIMDNL